MSQNNTIDRLRSIYKNGQTFMAENGLDMRVLDLSTLSEREKTKESLQHGKAKYQLSRTDRSVSASLLQVKNGDKLLSFYNDVSFDGISRTYANTLGLKLDKLAKIIDIILKGPVRYLLEGVALDKATRYSKSTGSLTYLNTEYICKNSTKELMDYLWGKRSVKSLSELSREANPSHYSGIFNNLGISESRTITTVDNFNKQTKKKKIPAKIVRKQGLIFLEVRP